MAGPFDRWSDGAKRVLALAQSEAADAGHNWIGTEHLMLGLVRIDTPAARVLADNGVRLTDAREAVLQAVPRREGRPPEMTLTPRVKSVLERANHMREERGDASVTPEILLRSLISDPDGIGPQVLASLGAMNDRLVAALDALPPGAA